MPKATMPAIIIILTLTIHKHAQNKHNANFLAIVSIANAKIQNETLTYRSPKIVNLVVILVVVPMAIQMVVQKAITMEVK